MQLPPQHDISIIQLITRTGCLGVSTRGRRTSPGFPQAPAGQRHPPSHNTEARMPGTASSQHPPPFLCNRWYRERSNGALKSKLQLHPSGEPLRARLSSTSTFALPRAFQGFWAPGSAHKSLLLRVRTVQPLLPRAAQDVTQSCGRLSNRLQMASPLHGKTCWGRHDRPCTPCSKCPGKPVCTEMHPDSARSSKGTSTNLASHTGDPDSGNHVTRVLVALGKYFFY